MASPDPHRISSLAELRELIEEPMPGMELLKGDGELTAETRAFVSRSPFLILSTADREGNQDASPKGDAPGFVLVEDDQTLVIPDRPGNRLVYGHQNILANPKVGVLFLIPGTPETLRVNGRAELTRDPAVLERLAARGKPAVLAIRVHIDECFFHCAKAFLRAQLWKPETWLERVRISFGRIAARKLKAGDEVAESIDKAVDEDYRTNL